LNEDSLLYKRERNEPRNLFEIPLKEIESVDRLHSGQEIGHDQKPMFMFEICLRTDFESLFFVN